MDNQENTEKENSINVDISTPIEWVAQEYYAEPKNKGWYIISTTVVVILMVISIFLIKSISFAILIFVMAAAVVVYSKRRPSVLKYTLSVKQGLYIEDKLYNLQDYKSFSITQDRGRYLVTLIPVKRFAPSLSVFFPQEIGEKAVDILASRLPMEEMQPDLVDKIIKYLKI